MSLTDKRIKSAAWPLVAGGAGSKLSDGGGLYVLVSPQGSKGWRLKYHFPANRERLMALGTWPDVSLTEARRRRDEIRAMLRQGIDPQAAKEATREAHGHTFKVVADQYLEMRKAKTSAITQQKQSWLLGLLQSLHSRPVGAISTRDVVAALERIEKSGRHETTHRASMFVGQVYRYASQKGITDNNPAAAVRGSLAPVVVTHRAGLTDPAAVGGLLRAIDDYVGEPEVRHALRLAPLVFVRPGELRGTQWSEIDLKTATWTIPGPRMKMKRPHVVPLSTQALAIFEELKRTRWNDTTVFPGHLGSSRPMSNNTLTCALRRMGYSGEQQTVHGFRTTASTLLNERGFDPELIELQLAHADSNKVRAAYNRAERLPERREMMQKWADYLDTLRNSK